MKNIFAKIGLTTLSILFLSFTTFSSAEGRAPREVDCDEGETIQARLDMAQDGDVIEVSGSCSENIRIVNNSITLRGVGGATLDGPDTTEATIDIRGSNTTISDFASISGGRNVIQVRRGASAVIDGNTIKDGRRGILVNQGAYARIVANIIGNFLNPLTMDGITVRQSAAADIVSNVITENERRGIRVTDGATADIEGNTITDNDREGILVLQTSHIRLSGAANTLERNGREGVACDANSTISGDLQTFGTGGDANGDSDGDSNPDTRIDVSCVVDPSLGF